MVEKIEIEITQGEGNHRELKATVRFPSGKSAQFRIWKKVVYSGGGSTNPKPTTEYLGETIGHTRTYAKPVGRFSAGPLPIGKKHAGETIEREITECFRITDGHVYIGFGSVNGKPGTPSFMNSGSSISLRKIL
jgi:hypothetical protein